MKKILTYVALTLVVIFSFPTSLFAGYVNGYYRSNGTYVNGYYRTTADGNPYNNYSYPGNYNPNTGSITGGNADTYLNNYYKNSLGGSSYNSSLSGSYLSPTTPSCPLMATYDSVSGSCKCLYGYVIDSSGSCSSGTIVCSQKYGYGSSFNSLNKTCECSSGYQFGTDGKCVSNENYCTDTFGYGAQYSYLKSKCVCRDGYVVNSVTNKCDSASSASYQPSYMAPLTGTSYVSCPINSYQSNGACYCQDGYEFNYYKTQCVQKPKNGCSVNEYTQDNGSCVCKFGNGLNGVCKTATDRCREWNGDHSFSKTQDDTNCACETGYALKNNKCEVYVPSSWNPYVAANVSTVDSSSSVKSTDSCTASIGEGAILIGSRCYCSKGYSWDIGTNKCFKSQVKITQSLKQGSSGTQVTALKNFLANQGLYFGPLDSSYDMTTADAVSAFQAQNSLPQAGSVGPKTRDLINKIIN